MPSYAADFSFLELVYLSDALGMHNPGPESGDRPYPDLLEIILGGIAARPAGEPDWRWTAKLTLMEWWMVREVSKSSVAVGSEKVGLNLLIKCAKAITALKADPVLHDAAMIVGDAEGQDPEIADQRTKLRLWEQGQERKEQPDAARPKDDSSEDHHAGHGAGA